MIIILFYTKVSPQTSTSGSTAEMPSIPWGFLYLSLWLLGNPVTSFICCSLVIVRSIVGCQGLCRVRAEWSRVDTELLQNGRELTTKVRNNLSLSLCTVPQSVVACVVAYFRRMELLPGVQERSGILLRERIEHIKDIIDINLWTKELGCN